MTKDQLRYILTTIRNDYELSNDGVKYVDESVFDIEMFVNALGNKKLGEY